MKKITQNNADGLLIAFDEDGQTNTAETHTGRVIVKNNKVSKIIEKSIKMDNSKRLAGIYHFKKWSEFIKFSKKTF